MAVPTREPMQLSPAPQVAAGGCPPRVSFARSVPDEDHYTRPCRPFQVFNFLKNLKSIKTSTYRPEKLHAGRPSAEPRRASVCNHCGIVCGSAYRRVATPTGRGWQGGHLGCKGGPLGAGRAAGRAARPAPFTDTARSQVGVLCNPLESLRKTLQKGVFGGHPFWPLAAPTRGVFRLAYPLPHPLIFRVSGGQIGPKRGGHLQAAFRVATLG